MWVQTVVAVDRFEESSVDLKNNLSIKKSRYGRVIVVLLSYFKSALYIIEGPQTCCAIFSHGVLLILMLHDQL